MSPDTAKRKQVSK